jgi:methionine synthase II (cobalamin-independent)
MAKDYITLSAAQKEEIRRLTQFANRRIANAFKSYEKEGMDVVPNEITGGIQTREDWASDKYAISRSIKFASQKEYREQLHWLRQFEVMRPSITEYSEAQQEKTLQGLETALGDVPNALKDMVKKLSAPELTSLWN